MNYVCSFSYDKDLFLVYIYLHKCQFMVTQITTPPPLYIYIYKLIQNATFQPLPTPPPKKKIIKKYIQFIIFGYIAEKLDFVIHVSSVMSLAFPETSETVWHSIYEIYIINVFHSYYFVLPVMDGRMVPNHPNIKHIDNEQLLHFVCYEALGTFCSCYASKLFVMIYTYSFISVSFGPFLHNSLYY